MNEAVHRYLSPGARQKIYLALAFVSLILLFDSVSQVSPIIVDREATFGLAAYLPPFYWTGLALIVLTSVFAFLDKGIKKDALFIALLIVVGLFLFGVTPLFKENPYQPTTYSPFSHVGILLESNYIDIAHPPKGFFLSYYSWPAFHFINAAILEVSGISINSETILSLLKYMTLYFMLCFVLITYSIGKQFKLEPNWCFLISFLAMSSWLMAYAGFYHPRVYAMIQALLIFMLLLTTPRTVASTIAILLLFSAVLLTHSLVVVTLILGVVTLALYRRDTRLVLLFIVATGAWYMFMAVIPLGIGIEKFMMPLRELLHFVRLPGRQEIASPALTVLRWSQLFYLTSYAVLMAVGAFLLLKRKIIEDRRKQVLALFAFVIGCSLTLVLGFYEIAPRTYLFVILPALCIVGLSLPRRKLVSAAMVVLMLLFVAFHLPANYTYAGKHGPVLTSELKGAEFLVAHAKLSGVSWFYAYDAHLFLFFDPFIFETISVLNQQTVYEEFLFWRERNVYLPSPIALLNDVNYVVVSSHGIEHPHVDWKAWPQTEGGEKSNLIYNNRRFRIYNNHLERQPHKTLEHRYGEIADSSSNLLRH